MCGCGKKLTVVLSFLLFSWYIDYYWLNELIIIIIIIMRFVLIIIYTFTASFIEITSNLRNDTSHSIN